MIDLDTLPIGPVGKNPIIEFRIGLKYFERTLVYCTKDAYVQRLYYWNDDTNNIEFIIPNDPRSGLEVIGIYYKDE